MQTAAQEEVFDDIETLLEQDSHSIATNEVDSLEDLDVLLSESVLLSAAMKARRQGRKLSAEQSEVMVANQTSVDMLRWKPQEVFGVIAQISCECGNCFQEFRGWYQYQLPVRGDGRRMLRVDCHEGLPASKFLVEEITDYCHACAVDGLPLATVHDCDLLEELGQSYEPCDKQLSFNLSEEAENA